MNPLERALLQAALDDPADDGIRLIYADWLEENGRPGRAEFIRAQIEDTQLPPAAADRRRTLRARQAALVAEYGNDWAAELPPLVEAHLFRRGFVDHVRMRCLEDVQTLIAQLEALLALEPVTCLHLRSGVIDPRCPDGSYQQIPLSDLEAFIAAPCAWRLRALDLSMGAIPPAGAFVLAAGTRLTSLERLKLDAAGLTDAEARALAESPHLKRLSGLDVNCNSISPAGARLLRQRFGGGVRLEDGDPRVIVWPWYNAPLPWDGHELG